MEAFLTSFQLQPTTSGSLSASGSPAASPTLSNTTDASSSSNSCSFSTAPLFHAGPIAGSFGADSTNGKFNLSWDTETDFNAWLTDEQRHNTIELQLVHTITGLLQFSFVEKKLLERTRKIPSKSISCQCSLVAKQYANTTKLLRKYHDKHNHPLSATNLPFTWIPKEMREFIAGHLHDQISVDAVLDLVHSGAYKDHEQFNDTSDDNENDTGRMPLRTQLIQLRDIH
ncbi:hypothetical protein DFH08DRAFT_966341 [Mycena albidolilacea]|uniref:Uncharacterized protein n=1 Tax=Mycena albidolilacea TaxID=1033008 RepID=A0AAD6ZNM4_9AGAR|nr:hypothetical protein DFH08DRAFT_966341 [Mycena albidolilacea]